jgi:hypothetical protein
VKSYLSARQVVQRLGGAISVKLVYKLCGQKKLRCNRNLGKVLVEEDSLVELLEGRPRPPPPPEEPPPKRRVNRKNPGIEMELW